MNNILQDVLVGLPLLRSQRGPRRSPRRCDRRVGSIPREPNKPIQPVRPPKQTGWFRFMKNTGCRAGFSSSCDSLKSSNSVRWRNINVTLIVVKRRYRLFSTVISLPNEKSQRPVKTMPDITTHSPTLKPSSVCEGLKAFCPSSLN